jgi:hypothetical protein
MISSQPKSYHQTHKRYQTRVVNSPSYLDNIRPASCIFNDDTHEIAFFRLPCIENGLNHVTVLAFS